MISSTEKISKPSSPKSKIAPPPLSLRSYGKEIGDLSSLETPFNDSLVSAINDSLTAASNLLTKSFNYNIRTYTALNQIGLDDNMMSPDDFTGNLEKIITAMTGPCILFLYTPTTANNLKQSIRKKMAEDGTWSVNENKIHVKIESPSGLTNDETKIELFFESGAMREKTIVCYANKDSNTLHVYPFKEVSYSQKLDTSTIELLNNWTLHNEGLRIEKIGNFVWINGILLNGVRTNSTTVFNLPVGYRPINKSISVPVFIQEPTLKDNGSFVIQTNGNVHCWYLDGTTNPVKIACGFLVD